MSLSVLDIFKIGLGPSSSHTMGPMNAAAAFVDDLRNRQLLGRVAKIGAQVYGSLALTGHGHFTDRAGSSASSRPAPIPGWCWSARSHCTKGTRRYGWASASACGS